MKSCAPGDLQGFLFYCRLWATQMMACWLRRVLSCAHECFSIKVFTSCSGGFAGVKFIYRFCEPFAFADSYLLKGTCR